MIAIPSFFGHAQVPGSIISSIQFVEIIIPTGSTSSTASISTVDTARSFLTWGHFTTANTGTSAREMLSRIELTDTTTITARRNTSSATYTVVVRCYVVECNGGVIESVQQGTIALSSVSIIPPSADGSDGGTYQTASITPVDLTRSDIFYLGNTVAGTNLDADAQIVAIDFYDNTKVRARRGSTGLKGANVNYVVVQFTAGYTQSIQRGTLASSSNSTTDTATVSSVNTANSLLFYKGAIISGSSYADDGYFHRQLADSTTITFTRSGTTTNSRTHYYSVIEFAPGILKSNQGGTTNISTSSPVDITITSVSMAKSFALWNGQLCNGTAGGDIFTSVKLENATTVRINKGVLTTQSTQAWVAPEFN